MKLEIKALKLELGKANAEIDHLNHALKEKVTAEFLKRYESKTSVRNTKVRYARLLNEFALLKK